MRNYLFALVVVIGVALIAGCAQQAVAPDATEDGSASQPATDGAAVATGGIRLNTASIAPWVVTKKGAEPGPVTGPSSRAMMLLTTSILDLWDSSGNLYDELVLAGPVAIAGTYDWTDLPVDTYDLEVYVYNEYNTDYSTPTVTGWAYNISVTDGGYTEAVVTCTPYSYEWLDEGYYSTQYSLPEMGETWFEFSPSTASTDVVCQSDSGDMDVYVFGPDGVFLDSSAVSGTGVEYVTIDTSSGIGDTYYVAMWAYVGGSGEVGYQPYGSGGGAGTIGILIQ